MKTASKRIKKLERFPFAGLYPLLMFFDIKLRLFHTLIMILEVSVFGCECYFLRLFIVALKSFVMAKRRRTSCMLKFNGGLLVMSAGTNKPLEEAHYSVFVLHHVQQQP